MNEYIYFRNRQLELWTNTRANFDVASGYAGWLDMVAPIQISGSREQQIGSFQTCCVHAGDQLQLSDDE